MKYVYHLGMSQNPGQVVLAYCNDGGLRTGLAALTGCNESLKTVHKVGMDCGVVEMVPVHHCLHKRVFMLLIL